MSQTNPTAVDALPTAPSTTAPSTFATLADAFVAALATFRTQINNIATNVYNNAVDCYNNAVAAAASANAAAASTNVIKWISGTSYTEGNGVWSPITYQSYRRKVTGAGTTDPSADTTNWELIGAIGTAGANLTGGLNEARGNIAMHATTMDLFALTSPNVLDGTGGAVTITDIADAPQAGARRVLYPVAASIITNGATFAVDGAANQTAAAGDRWEFEAITVSTFKVHVTKASGAPVSQSQITNVLGADVALNNTANYFTGPTIAQGTAGTWFVCGTVTLQDTAGAAAYKIRLTDGATVIAATVARSTGAGADTTATISGYIANPANNLRINVNDPTSTSGKIVFNSSGDSKDSSIFAIRVA